MSKMINHITVNYFLRFDDLRFENLWPPFQKIQMYIKCLTGGTIIGVTTLRAQCYLNGTNSFKCN